MPCPPCETVLKDFVVCPTPIKFVVFCLLFQATDNKLAFAKKVALAAC